MAVTQRRIPQESSLQLGEPGSGAGGGGRLACSPTIKAVEEDG